MALCILPITGLRIADPMPRGKARVSAESMKGKATFQCTSAKTCKGLKTDREGETLGNTRLFASKIALS